MIQATRNWFRRNRNVIAVTAGVIGGTYLVGQYIVGKISEARERASLDRIAKENLRRRFEQNQADCTFTVLALLPTVTENVLRDLPVEQLTSELQQKRAERLARSAGEGASEISSSPSSLRDGDTGSLTGFGGSSYLHASQTNEGGSQRPRKSKAQLWNEIKISSVTRALTLIYTLSLLILLTRIQLNLLGRQNYVTAVIASSQPPPPGRSNSISLEDHDDSDLSTSAEMGNDFEINRRFLTFSWQLLHRGYAQLMAQIQDIVEEVFHDISPTEAIGETRLKDLMLAIRRRVEGSTEQERYTKRWLPYILPPREEEESMLIESGIITPPSSSRSDTPGSSSGPNRQASSYINVSSGPLRRLLDETADLVDSPTFTRIHTLILNTLFSHLIDTRVTEQAFPSKPSTTQSPPSSVSTSLQNPLREVDSSVTVVPGESRVKLATILAVITRQAHIIGNGNSPPNEYVSLVDVEVMELESFAAVIYANNLSGSVDEARPKTVDSSSTGVKPAEGTGVTDVGVERADEMLESRLEGAWSRVMGSTFSSWS